MLDSQNSVAPCHSSRACQKSRCLLFRRSEGGAGATRGAAGPASCCGARQRCGAPADARALLEQAGGLLLSKPDQDWGQELLELDEKLAAAEMQVATQAGKAIDNWRDEVLEPS